MRHNVSRQGFMTKPLLRRTCWPPEQELSSAQTEAESVSGLAGEKS